jgi:hydrogenase maturation protease
MTSILVAGIGNIFKGDDAFGVEVARLLAQRELPAGVKVIDFGIRGIDLTYALLDAYDAAVLVDTAQRGEQPGTISVVEPEPYDAGAASPDDLMLSPHELDPAKVLRLVAALGGTCRRVLLVACEPLTFGGDDGVMGLSQPVAAALDAAVKTVENLIAELTDTEAREAPTLIARGIHQSMQEGVKP